MPVAFLLLSAIVALILADIGTATVRRTLAHRLLDVPNARSSHVRPTPRGGGIAIVTVVLAGCAVYALLFDAWSNVAAVAAGGAVIAAISLADDLWQLPAPVRLAVHVIVATLVVGQQTDWSGFSLPFLAAPAQLVLSVIWVVGLTNAYNFMDGIDGIAAGQGMIAGAAWAVLGWLLSAPGLVVMGGLIAAACAGFIRHNWAPARIFMGDGGSAFLGFMVAALPFLSRRQDGAVAAAAIAMVGLFVFDTAFTLARRIARREHIWEAHRTHLYQRLVATGVSHATVTSLYGGLGVLLAAAGVLAGTTTISGAVALALVVAVGVGLIVLVRHAEHDRGLRPAGNAVGSTLRARP